MPHRRRSHSQTSSYPPSSLPTPADDLPQKTTKSNEASLAESSAIFGENHPNRRELTTQGTSSCVGDVHISVTPHPSTGLFDLSLISTLFFFCPCQSGPGGCSLGVHAVSRLENSVFMRSFADPPVEEVLVVGTPSWVSLLL